MNKNVRVVYKKITEKLKKDGYINLNHRLVNSKDDLVDIASIFRSHDFETFRIIYIKDNRIAGYESITSRNPVSAPLFSKKTKYINNEKGFYKVKDRMKRLMADGYYMVHNHPSGNAKASSDDVKVTKEFIKRVEGFKGHLIIGSNQYSWIEKDESYLEGVRVDDYQDINFKKADKFSKMMKKKSVYDVKISSRTDLVSFINHLNTDKDYSIAILTDVQNKVRMILDIPNSMLNQSMEQLNGFFRNQGKISGGSRVLFATESKETFKKSLEHLNYGTFKDSILYKEMENNRIALKEASKEISEVDLYEKRKRLDPIINFGNLFVDKENITLGETESLNFSDYLDENDFYQIPYEDKSIDKEKEDEKEPGEKEIRVLFKSVGKKPIVKVIPDTLYAKQVLVGGLIEVVPYYDDMLLVCNEEGKLLGLNPNLVFDWDYIAGDCFIIGDDYENGDFRSLTHEEIRNAKEDLKGKSFIYKLDEDRPIEEEKGMEQEL